VPEYLIIDGYNAISKIKELEDKKDISLEASRMYFIKMLSDFTHRNRTFDKIIVVFDSKERGLGVSRESYGGVEVLFATNDKDADGVIVDLLRDASDKDRIKVASDDNFVRNHARVYGSGVIAIKELRAIIMLKKRKGNSKIAKDEDMGDIKRESINAELRKHWRLE